MQDLQLGPFTKFRPNIVARTQKHVYILWYTNTRSGMWQLCYSMFVHFSACPLQWQKKWWSLDVSTRFHYFVVIGLMFMAHANGCRLQFTFPSRLMPYSMRWHLLLYVSAQQLMLSILLQLLQFCLCNARLQICSCNIVLTCYGYISKASPACCYTRHYSHLVSDWSPQKHVLFDNITSK